MRNVSNNSLRKQLYNPHDGKTQYKDYNQNEFLLVPPCIGDIISENHPVRTANAILGNFDISVIESTYKGGGTTSYHLRLLLKIVMYAYLTNIYYGRRMASLYIAQVLRVLELEVVLIELR